METSDPAQHRSLIDDIRSRLNRREKSSLSDLAAKSENGVRRDREPNLESGYRQPFAVDADRILHSNAYARYIDKTQVFYLVKNDHITHRVLHVQLVSKIGRTIGRFLGLNEDIIEAIALGHDIGHTPFGHDGEACLSELCVSAGIGYFQHNVQSIQFLDRVERRGRGWNLCLQTLDGILCHDGEVHNQALSPQPDKTFESLDAEIRLKKKDPSVSLLPMTLEGCAVRMADTIAYIGRDIEDAIRLGIIRRSDLPRKCVKVLGETNGTIVHHLVSDIIHKSHGETHVQFSGEISEALRRLKSFNLERIYMNPTIKRHTGIIKKLFQLLFSRFCEDVDKNNTVSVIFTDFLSDKSEAYLSGHQMEEKVRDFIAGMTDQYFLRLCPKDMRPGKVDI